ncbi:hypothetical protein C8R43DRAFT_961722 [Mycena crocata]|nr:hypothetical protein C8R43DRAFT_961722 [Mycena crocata]
MTTQPDAPATASNSPNAQVALEELLATVAGLSQMSLAMAKHCLDVQTRVPAVVNAAIAAGIASLVPSPPIWIRQPHRTPEELEAAHPPGIDDDIAYHVVTVGREPGLYTSVTQSDFQVLGVPDQKRKRQGSLAEALAYYRIKYDKKEIAKWVPQTAPAVPTAPAASTSSAPRPA